MPADLLPSSRSALVLMLLTAAALLLASCDTAGVEPAGPHAPAATESAGLRPVPIPEGARLLPAPDSGTPGSGPKRTSARRIAGLDAAEGAQEREGASEGAPEGASPYGCFVASLDPDGQPFAYRYDRVYLHFPERVLRAAGGESEVVRMVLGTRTLYANGGPAGRGKDGGGAAASAYDEPVVARAVRCRLPRAEEATTLLTDLLRRFRARRAEESGRNRRAMTVEAFAQHFAAQRAAAETRTTSRNASGRNASGSSAAAPPARTNDTTCPGSITDERGCDMDEVIVVGDPGGGSFTGTLPGGGGSGGGEDPLGGGYDDGQETICITCGIDNRSGGGGEQTQAEKLADDYVPNADTTYFNCDQPEREMFETEKAWCASSKPTGERLEKTKSVIEQMEQLGGECADIAQRAREMLSEGSLRYFPSGTIAAGGKGGSNFALVESLMVDRFFDESITVNDPVEKPYYSVKMILQASIAHEVEHEMGRPHIKLPDGRESDWQTPHSKECSGLY